IAEQVAEWQSLSWIAVRMHKMNTLTIGTNVTNLVELATVVGFHEVTGDPILQDADGQRWIADADECEAPDKIWMHKDGFVEIG
ncbi:MAG: hypothetical protein IJ608_05315, partial [Lachnospiraceae bacterium]|nr:hypothetical protein [Lachnospiraceae bacterium]